MKRLVVVVLFSLLAVTDAAAQSPAPTLVRFDLSDAPGQYTHTLVERTRKIHGVRDVENLLHTTGTEAPMHH